MITVHIPSYLRQFTGGLDVVRLEGTPITVAQALSLLWQAHPGVRDRVLCETGEIREHVNVFVGDESIRYTGGLATNVTDGDELSIIPAVSGG